MILKFLVYRALGMIDKSGPLWRAISKDGHILDMNAFYQGLYDKFIFWRSSDLNLI